MDISITDKVTQKLSELFREVCWHYKRQPISVLRLLFAPKLKPCAFNGSGNAILSIGSFATQRAIDRMYSDASSNCHVFYGWHCHAHRLANGNEFFCPDIIAHPERNFLPDCYILQRNPLIGTDA